MNTDDICARLGALAAKIQGEHPRVALVIANTGRLGLYAESSASHEIFRGHGADLAAMLAECEAAIDAAHPDTLARTLGVEVAA